MKDRSSRLTFSRLLTVSQLSSLSPLIQLICKANIPKAFFIKRVSYLYCCLWTPHSNFPSFFEVGDWYGTWYSPGVWTLTESYADSIPWCFWWWLRWVTGELWPEFSLPAWSATHNFQIKTHLLTLKDSLSIGLVSVFQPPLPGSGFWASETELIRK